MFCLSSKGYLVLKYWGSKRWNIHFIGLVTFHGPLQHGTLHPCVKSPSRVRSGEPAASAHPSPSIRSIHLLLAFLRTTWTKEIMKAKRENELLYAFTTVAKSLGAFCFMLRPQAATRKSDLCVRVVKRWAGGERSEVRAEWEAEKEIRDREREKG